MYERECLRNFKEHFTSLATWQPESDENASVASLVFEDNCNLLTLVKSQSKTWGFVINP